MANFGGGLLTTGRFSSFVKKYGGVGKLPLPHEEEMVNVCKAIEDIREAAKRGVSKESVVELPFWSRYAESSICPTNLLSQRLPTDELDPDVKAFLDYMMGAVGNNDFVRGVDDEIRREKENPNEEAVFMTYQMKLDEERRDANEETVVRRLLRFAKRHAQPGQQDIQEIAEDSDVSVERVRELAEKNGIDLA